MSGLVAVIATPGAAPVDPSEVRRLSDDYEAVRGSFVTTVKLSDRVGAVRFSRVAEGPGLGRPEPSWALSTGTVHGSRSWVRSAAQELAEVDGQFALVSYDAGADQAVVATDPLGMLSVYHARRPGRVYIATSALVLARHLSPPASLLALQSFLLSGYHFGTRTHWDEVQRLEPGVALTFGRLTQEHGVYWRPSVDASVWALPFQAAVEHSIEVCRDTYSSYLAGAGDEYWADLTGGYDSRLLCLLLDAAGVPFITNTRTTTITDDVDIARRLAALQGWVWMNPSLPEDWPDRLVGELPSSLAWGDGQLEVLQLARVLHAHSELAQRRERLLSAGGGEHFQFYAWQSEFHRAGRGSRVDWDRWIDMIALKPTADRVVSGSARSSVKEDLRSRLVRWLEPYASERNTTQLEMAYAYKCMGHFGAYRSADSAHLTGQLPFYYKPVFEAAFSTHHKHRNGHRLMRGMIDSLSHEAARIRTTRGGPALPWRPWRAHAYAPYYAVLGRKAVNKLSASAIGKPLLLRRSAFPWQSAANAAVMRESRGQLLDWQQMRIAKLLDRSQLSTLLAGSTGAGFTDSGMLGRILTCEMALRVTDTVLQDS